MDIVCCTDMNYVPYCGVMLASLLENNRKVENLVIHVIDNALTDEGRDTLRRLVGRKYGRQITFYSLKKELMELLPDTNSYVSLTAYCKLFIANILPVQVHRVLSLDCDLIVVSSLQDLWEYDLEGKPLAAVKDAHRKLREDCLRLGIDYQKEGYYNSGVMLLDLDCFRRMNFQKIALDFMAEHGANLPYHDQDVLNGTLHGQIISLPLRYNLHDCLFHSNRHMDFEDEVYIEQELRSENRVIIHFSSRRKPWGTRCLHPLRKLFFEYLDRTEWRGTRPKYSLKDYGWLINRRVSGWLNWVNGYRRIC